MSFPGLVRSALGEESVDAEIDLGGGDAVYVSPTRTLVYRADGLLSDESIEEYPHDAERIDVSIGRRKAKLELDYGLDGSRTLAVPADRLDDVLAAVLSGVFRATGTVAPDERVLETYRFSELTIVLTDARVVKHIGSAVWDEEYEEFRYEDVTGLAFEEGSVAMQVVLRVGERQERFKAPNDRARELEERLREAILAYHDVDSFAALGATNEPDRRADEGPTFESGVEPLSAEPRRIDGEESADEGRQAASGPIDETTDGGSAAATSAGDHSESDRGEVDAADAEPLATAGFEPAVDTAESGRDRIDRLTEAVERQNELLASQQATIERLIEELSRGRDR